VSGFVGLVNFDGQPVDERLLRRMTASLGFRGPDAQRRRADGHVGLGHALLTSTREAAADHQPFSLDGETWIVADARIDGRRELAARLSARGQSSQRDATDAELLLRAYRVWEDACTDHLIGDFAFAIWDGPRRRLFAARDQLGVKSFFYALAGRTLVFSNTLDTVRMHPFVSDRLNDLAIADFLLFELNQDPATTVFADIQRLPPAHRVSWSDAGGLVSRYWTLPVDEPVFFRRSADYVDRFNELVDAAVSDRLRTDRVSLFMSGGLDSTAIAAVASRVFRRQGRPNGVRAFTTIVDGLDAGEGRFARLVAERLNIAISIDDGGDPAFDPEWQTRRIHTPSPVRNVAGLVTDTAAYAEMLRHSRVAFYGEGPDNALQYEWQPYMRYLRRRRRFVRVAGDVLRHVRSHRRLPLQSLVPRMLRARRERGRWDLSYPRWLNPELERRFKLRERWTEVQDPPTPDVVHPVRPAAYYSFSGPEWEALFRGFDPEETGFPLDVRHPYVDLRVLRYLLSVPVVPWCRSKHLIRRAMKGVLPEDLLARPKTGLSSDPDYDAANRLGLPPLSPATDFDRFVDVRRVPEVSRSSMIDFRADFRPRALNFWLANLDGSRPHVDEESKHGVAHA
jgi:asparagine synthase (glutamine-hydrolysing)